MEEKLGIKRRYHPAIPKKLRTAVIALGPGFGCCHFCIVSTVSGLQRISP